MRANVTGVVIGLVVGLVLQVIGSQHLSLTSNSVQAQPRGASLTRGGSLRQPGEDSLAAVTVTSEGIEYLVVIDSSTRTLGSYRVDGKTGQVALKCIRDIRWDLEMDEFNGTEPTPEQIRALLRSR